LSAPLTDGASLKFETVPALGADLAPVRLRPREDILLRVIDGVVRLVINDEEQLLGIGDEAIVPAGASHRISGVVREARCVMGLRTRLY
jgi:mannose-6-phosphate isomerase-like protein (cupin superfamily)